MLDSTSIWLWSIHNTIINMYSTHHMDLQLTLSANKLSHRHRNYRLWNSVLDDFAELTDAAIEVSFALTPYLPPPPLPPVIYDQVVLAQPEGVDAAVDAWPLPPPRLQLLQMSTEDLVCEIVAVLSMWPTASHSQVAEAVSDRMSGTSEAQLRVVQLSATLAVELLQAAADRLLQETEARFGHNDLMLLPAILMYLCDQLGNIMTDVADPQGIR